MHRLHMIVAATCLWQIAAVAHGQVRVTEQLSLSGTVEAVAAGVVTLRSEDGERLQVRIQRPDEQGVALADGRLLSFPAETTVSGVVDPRKVAPGQIVRFRAELNGVGKASGEVAELTLVDARGARVGATWATPPAKPAEYAACEVVAPLKQLSKTRLAVELPAGSPFKKPTVVSVAVAKELAVRLSSADPRRIAAGARVVTLEAARLDTGDLVVRRLVVENTGGVAIDAGRDDALVRRFGKLSAEPRPAPREVRSKHFAFLTDISDREWAIVEFKLERMVGLLEAYFGRKAQGVVEGFIVRDLAAFPPGTLAEPMGVEKIRRGEGICFNSSLGPQRRAQLYSCADHGVIQHECTHGFCHVTFGSTGPTWLAEGVAEMGNYWKEGDLAVDVPPAVMGYLQNAPERRGLLEIAVPGRTDAGTWQDYAWRWALCHLLANNPNYADRFKPLAIQLMEERPGVSFESVYGPVAREISFEYDQFLRTVGNGYRADLAAWPWKGRFRPLREGGRAESRVQAQGGWQAGGVEVEEGVAYEIAAEGSWRTGRAGQPLDAAGDAAGHGRLVAAVLTAGEGFALTPEIPLGTRATFEAPASGRLHFRCADDWTQLADNDGEIDVTVSRP